MNEESGQEVQWPQVMNDYFKLSLSDSDAVRWFNDIHAKYYSINNSKLCDVIRWAADERNYRRPEKAGKPTTQELMKWIAMSWAAERNSQIPKLACSMCLGSGWVPWSRDIADNSFTLEEYNMSITTVIPCACSVGRTIFEREYGVSNKHHNPVIEEMKQKAVARQAIKQRQELQRLKDSCEREFKANIRIL